MKKFSKSLSVLFALLLVFAFLPAQVFANPLAERQTDEMVTDLSQGNIQWREY